MFLSFFGSLQTDLDHSNNGSSISSRLGGGYGSASGYVDVGDCNPQCTLSSDPGYVLYSAIGSFFIPMLVMIFFNFKIYTTAKKTTKEIRQGFTKVKSDGKDIGGMGIHRGRRKTNLITLNINGNFQSEYELVEKRRRDITKFSTQLSIESTGSADSLYRKNSFTSKSLSGKKMLQKQEHHTFS